MIQQNRGTVLNQGTLWKPVDRYTHGHKIERGPGLLLDVPVGGYPVASDSVVYCLMARTEDGLFISGIVDDPKHNSRGAEVDFHEGTGSVDVIVTPDRLLTALKDYRALLSETRPHLEEGSPPIEWYCACLDKVITEIQIQGIAEHVRREFDYFFDHVAEPMLPRQ